ncbi:MAG: tail fiber domain-containing protein [Ferruginibacter sp.]
MRIPLSVLAACFIVPVSLLGQNVGIGTSTPMTKLTVQTPLNTAGYTHVGGTNEIIVTEAVGTVSASIGTASNHPFRIMSNNAGLLHVYPGGEVVMGSNTSPAFGRLTVETLNNSYGISHTGENGNVLATRIGGTSAGIGTFSNTNMRLFCNSSSALIIDAANGNIGIGTDAPTARLHIAGDAKVTGNTNVDGNIGIGAAAMANTGLYINRSLEAIRITGDQSYITFFNGANYKGYVWNKGADDMEFGTAGVNTNGKLLLSVKGTPYLQVQNNGQVSVNGGPAPYRTPAFTTNGIFTIISPMSEWTIEASNEGSEKPRLNFAGNGFSRAAIDPEGDWLALSDRSVKEGIESYKEVLSGVKKLQVASYNFKHIRNQKKSLGLIAQDAAQYFPEIVSEMQEKDGKKLLGVAYAKTGVLAIKAIQEQQVIIEQLQNKVDMLEKRLLLLENK